jgi:O-antigen/teichoic acid export membrane protein
MKRNQILVNALTTLAQVIGSAAMLFFLYRFLIRTIGIERMGIWSLVLATTSVVTLANQGFSTGIVKFVAKYVARRQTEEVSVLVQTAVISIGLALGLLSLVLYPGAKWILKFVLPQNALAEAFPILPYALISLWTNVVGSILQAGLGGHELISQRNYVVLGGSLLYLLLTFALVPRFGLLGLAYSQTAQACACLVATWYLLRRQIPRFPAIPHRWSRALFSEMGAYGLQFQFITLSQAAREPVTKGLLAKFGGLAAVGLYDIATRWVVTFRETIVQANQVLVPTVASLQERDPKAIPAIYRESYRAIFFLAIPTFAFLVALSPIVSRIWIGRYEPTFVYFVSLLALGWLANVLSNPAYVVDLGTGALRWVSVGCITTAILNLTLGFVAGKYAGGAAVVAASMGSLVLGYVVVVMSYHVENRVPFRQLLPKESVGIVASSIVGALIFMPFFASAHTQALLSFRVATEIAAALIVIVVVPMWIHPMRRRLLDWALLRSPA